MANERMMQAIGRMERVLDRLESMKTPSHPAPLPLDPPRGISAGDPRRTRAEAALKSLDSLIADLKSRG